MQRYKHESKFWNDIYAQLPPPPPSTETQEIPVVDDDADPVMDPITAYEKREAQFIAEETDDGL